MFCISLAAFQTEKSKTFSIKRQFEKTVENLKRSVTNPSLEIKKRGNLRNCVEN